MSVLFTAYATLDTVKCKKEIIARSIARITDHVQFTRIFEC